MAHHWYVLLLLLLLLFLLLLLLLLYLLLLFPPTHLPNRDEPEAGKTPREHVDLSKARFKEDNRPIDESCGCETCTNYSRSYIHHLIKVSPPTHPPTHPLMHPVGVRPVRTTLVPISTTSSRSVFPPTHPPTISRSSFHPPTHPPTHLPNHTGKRAIGWVVSQSPQCFLHESIDAFDTRSHTQRKRGPG